MSREIKFRAWSGKEYHYQDDQYLSSFIWRFVRDVNYENGLNSEHEAYLKSHLNNYLEQFTGLTDKNGKEIYEGDVVKAVNDNGIIVFKNGMFMIEWQFKTIRSNLIHNSIEQIEVVGNIHDHPHLMEKQQ